MISLGSYDLETPPAALDAYIQRARHFTGVDDWQNKLRGEQESEWVGFEKLPAGEMKVADVQRFLKQAGFLPFGEIDGICGYRTHAAIRLFQEYVRTVEGDSSIGFPDGKFGPVSAGHVERWQQSGKQADWINSSSAVPSVECKLWLELLNSFKQNSVTNPNAMLKLVNDYAKPTDTLKPAQWQFDPQKIQLIGIRRNETAIGGDQQFDDLFILLINGLVFKFRGSTDPGKSENPQGLPFLVVGQHLYRFGWHLLSNLQRVYHALKPHRLGVLVVRSKDKALTDADLTGGLECNPGINIHWGGRGDGNVGSWSEGCQVFTGRAYINAQDKVIDCSPFAAPNYQSLGQKIGGVYQTKGAYTMLADLVAALSGANPDDNVVRYTLLYERDLALQPLLGPDKAKELVARFKS